MVKVPARHWSKCPLGSAPARLLRLLRARLAALGSSALPEKRPSHWARRHRLGLASGARDSRLQSRSPSLGLCLGARGYCSQRIRV
eukprot:scaffold36841_cov48-Phaeocystis_antarctica.AAC.1